MRADGWERARLATSWSAIRVVARQLPWRVGAAILPMCNTQVNIFGFVFDAINGFDGIGNVCEINKGTIPYQSIKVRENQFADRAWEMGMRTSLSGS